jgi:tRNA U34 5-methylaminomethyl-2-thiouridine-forming methyltransferase MnmC
MKREIIITGDGSPTLFVPELDEHYHSIHGAYNESMHVFIQAGLEHQLKTFPELKILEIGLGTASNLLLTIQYLSAHKNKVIYDAIEPFPLDAAVIEQLSSHYTNLYQSSASLFEQIHTAVANTPVLLNTQFQFTRLENTLEQITFSATYNLIYFDAFGPRAQPEIWSLANFEKLYQVMDNNGVLVTYCAKGEVRRTMQAAGFSVEKLPGPPGKREMLRATKNAVNFAL